MAEAGDGRLRLTILGGYLGSGKTTWLRHQLHVGGFGPRVRVLVNEAAEQPVDDALLAGRAGVEVLAGGCCCCVGRPALLDALRRVCDARSRIAADGRRLERIVLETSGLADPAPILAAIQADPVLVSHILVDETIVAVDALHALAQLRADPLGRRQLAAADRLILTKTDTCDAALLLATLRRLNPHASIEAAVRGEPVPLPAAGAEPADLPPMPDEDPRPVLATPVSVPADLDWADLASLALRPAACARRRSRARQGRAPHPGRPPAAAVRPQGGPVPRDPPGARRPVPRRHPRRHRPRLPPRGPEPLAARVPRRGMSHEPARGSA
ncbi:MAG: GTP-binding protein [Geminicoccaceae bacterium]